MTIMTRKHLQEIEEYYYWVGYKNWCPFPEELKAKLMDVYGEEPSPHCLTKQDIYEGTRKIIFNFFNNKSM
jgi:hypothetical protein